MMKKKNSMTFYDKGLQIKYKYIGMNDFLKRMRECGVCFALLLFEWSFQRVDDTTKLGHNSRLGHLLETISCVPFLTQWSTQ